MAQAEDVFEGEPGGLPEPMPRGRALYREAEAPTSAVRHVGGYAPFVDFCEAHGVRAGDLASDPERLISFLHEHGARLAADGALGAAAAVFAGNTIAWLRPDARWTAYEGAPPLVGNRERQFETGRLLEACAAPTTNPSGASLPCWRTGPVPNRRRPGRSGCGTCPGDGSLGRCAAGEVDGAAGPAESPGRDLPSARLEGTRA
ncbi:hypothetical protein [Arthrobacter sp. EPSL27]|uniref:hypothetical protein n=1 Tax=Arthrobacter sp. EPSL27 TaxID=1745378 RepID=UPI0007470DB2|nr:hypothetical protein [Arthrobacter sp. EPSL27]KUM38129.1 hypothetical protein AR539_02510 [Arthrobacter sp. EPSL27]